MLNLLYLKLPWNILIFISKSCWNHFQNICGKGFWGEEASISVTGNLMASTLFLRFSWRVWVGCQVLEENIPSLESSQFFFLIWTVVNLRISEKCMNVYWGMLDINSADSSFILELLKRSWEIRSALGWKSFPWELGRAQCSTRKKRGSIRKIGGIAQKDSYFDFLKTC